LIYKRAKTGKIYSIALTEDIEALQQCEAFFVYMLLAILNPAKTNQIDEFWRIINTDQ
jgi:hypothetical protein